MRVTFFLHEIKYGSCFTIRNSASLLDTVVVDPLASRGAWSTAAESCITRIPSEAIAMAYGNTY